MAQPAAAPEHGRVTARPTAGDFLAAVIPEGHIDLRAIPEGGGANDSLMAPAADREAVEAFAAKWSGKRHVYFGVAGRDGRGRGLENCTRLAALYVDVDFKDKAEDEARRDVAAFRFPPSILVASGGGLHVYWLLREPLDLTAEAGRRKAYRLLKVLCRRVGGDPKSAEPGRVLRLPWTLNIKARYAEPRLAALEEFHPERLYGPDLIDALGNALLSETADEASAPDEPAESLAPVKHDLPPGERSRRAAAWIAGQTPAVQGSGGDAKTFEICCAVAVGHDLDEAGALAVLRPWNATCRPPWSDRELAEKVRNAIKYATGRRGEMLERRRARTVEVTQASTITVRPVRWLWEGRVALGSLALLGGREGVGKSIFAYQLAADITRGRLPGEHHGSPRSVYVIATEDSWEHTIVPRLIAAEADLTRVFVVRVKTDDGAESTLSLPTDIAALGEQIGQTGDVALVILDPLMSRLASNLDTHKDAEVRKALEPVVRLSHSTATAVLGLIHVNKSASNDPLTLLMGSRAFAAVARTVLFVMKDPENEKQRLLGQAKNNLGRTDLPTLVFTIENTFVRETDEGPVFTGALRWAGETDRSIGEAIETVASGGDKAPVREATEWLEDFMRQQKDGWAWSTDVKSAGRKDGIGESTLKRAKARLRIETHSVGFPRKTAWALKGVQIPEQEVLPDL